MFLESEDTVPETDVEEDKLNFRDNLKYAIQHSNRNRKNVIERHLQVIFALNLKLYKSNILYVYFSLLGYKTLGHESH